MKNRITVQVAGHEFTLLSDDLEAYVQEIADEVNDEISEIMQGSSLSLNHAAILTSLNMADKARKAADSTEHLRDQVKVYLDETQKLKAELAEARREFSRVRKQH